MKKIISFSAVFFSLIFLAQKNADLIITNAKIYTVNEKFDISESMAISNGKILAVGKSADILKNYKSPKTLNLLGKTVFPGFIDAHCHFTGFATDKWKSQLWGTKSWDEIVGRITEYAKTAPREWIYGRGWDQNDWAMKEFPTKEKLDQLFPDRPVFVVISTTPFAPLEP